MISSTDQELADALAAGPKHGLIATLINPHTPITTSTVVPVTKWSEEVLDDGDLRKFTFGVPLMIDGESMWPGDNPAHPLYPAGQQVSLTWVIEAGLAVWQLGLGTYDLIEVSRDDTVVSVVAASPTHSLALVEQASPYTTKTGESKLSLARRLTGTSVVLAGATDGSVGAGLVMDVNAQKSFQALIDAWPARARFSANGIELVAEANVSASPVMTLEARDGLVLGGDSLSRDDIITRVVASGSGTAGGVGVAQEVDGPLSAQFVGYQTATYSSPLISSNSAAAAAAATRLRTLRNKTRTQEVVVALDPRLEAFDVVRIERPVATGSTAGAMVGQVVGVKRSFPAATMTLTVEVFSTEIYEED